MIHLTLIIAQRVMTYCGNKDFKETMRGEHYLTHVAIEDCCKELRNKICPDCLKQVTLGNI
jgi:hypothetical protein